MKKGSGNIIIGIILCVIQVLSTIGGKMGGNHVPYFTYASNFPTFIYELCFFLGANWMAITGVILIIIGISKNRIKWSSKKNKKHIEKITAMAQAEGMTLRQYIHKDIPQELEEMCEFYRGNSKELDKYLGTLVNDEKISYDAYLYLLEEYT